MPPEQEDARARQLEAMRQYFAELGGQRDGPTAETAHSQPASERLWRPSPPWLLLTGLLVAVALVGGVGRRGRLVRRPAGRQQDRRRLVRDPAHHHDHRCPMASAACKTAVDRVSAMLAIAVELQRSLAEYDKILNDRQSAGCPVVRCATRATQG